MIRIRYQRTAGEHRLTVTGHAGYAPAGSDIVCAAVSALILTLSAQLRRVGAQTESSVCEPGRFRIRCGASPAADAAFDMALTGCRLIAAHYPRHAEVDQNTPSEQGEEKENPYDERNHHGDHRIPRG